MCCCWSASNSCGTTWHAASLVTQLRASQRMTELAQYTGELFGKLEEETGQATGFKERLAADRKDSGAL